MPNSNSNANSELRKKIRDLCEADRDIILVSLATTDGFSIKSFASKSLGAESDKLAAMSSTIASLSESSAKQILRASFGITIIETESGNMLFVRTSYLGTPCVLTFVAREKMTLANARYQTKKLAKSISAISE